ncbi:hypothetical protein IFM89_025951 [Coptis chinensis]|uniref:Polysaccharide biosynthesis domain-containing protein n=1 Tax=Coptis chinensis TaxID=261450 RepID=A0A835HNT8_9MAGN|nr:hypothetical protein IFM89_025951 [Coptis chinensis]
MKFKNPHFFSGKLWFVVIGLAGLIAGALVITTISNSVSQNSFLCSLAGSYTTSSDPTNILQSTILHYATTRVVPQQSLSEIRVSFDVLQSLSPCNLLVFGLGHDSLMWSSFNPHGTSLFLEEDPKWVQTILRDAPSLHAHHVLYHTQLSQADELIRSYRSEQDCAHLQLKGNSGCRLALSDLPSEVYDKEWDLIMIDAPRGYFPEAPGRMGAIYSAAVMARTRKSAGVTHVFLHDVDRKVEKMFAEEFLCRKHLVHAVGRLWHFQIPSGINLTHSSNAITFCSN